MLFENPQIELEQLPSLGEVAWQALDRRYLRLLLLTTGIVFTLIALGLIVLAISVPMWVFWLALTAWALFLGVVILFVFKGFEYKKFALRRRDVIYQSGWIFRHTITVPFSRIQHVEIKEGALERLFGLGTVQVFTAGGSGSDLGIPGLPADYAHRIKEYISGKVAEEEEEE